MGDTDYTSCNGVREKEDWRTLILEATLRTLDCVIAAALILTTLPLMVVIGIIIRIDSPGPAIFRQVRMGKDRRNYRDYLPRNSDRPITERRKRNMWSRPFVFYKFRTMCVDARERFPELYTYQYTPEEINTLYFKRPDDPRVTRVGRFLRTTTLDELPNLFNVIRGDMSLVGPRPDIPEMIKYYTGEQRKKFKIKPGVTGLAQINGRGLLSFHETLKLDVELVEKFSLMTYLQTLVKTVKVTFLRIGAF
jgi:lipopolysaccharide/colanic/teichoic acid biosynthesis glycosyltransferase